MATNTSRKLLVISLALVLLTAALQLISNSFNFKALLGPYGEGNTLLIAMAITVAALLFLTYLRDKFSRPIAMGLPKNVAPDLTAFLESIKTRYKGRYRSKLEGRFAITLKVAEELSDGDSKVTITELSSQITKAQATEVIRQLFDKKGRLLIVGDPGAGKTVLLLKLAIELLEEIKDPNNEAFPLIFNLAGWSQYTDFGDWLKAMLVTDYDLSEAFAKKLLEEQRIIFFLDGLDELAHNEWWDRDELWTLAQKRVADRLTFERDPIAVRAACLRSLNNYLRDDRRAVICCRSEEYKLLKERNQEAPVAAKVRVLSLTERQVSEALTVAAKHRSIRHHAAATNLLTMSKSPEGHDLLEVLTTPFYFTLALEIFDREILTLQGLPKESKEIKSYLIQKFIQSRLENSSRRFGADESLKWLKWLAHFMQSKHFVTFQLHDLQEADLTDRMDRWRYDFWSKAIVALLLFVVGFFVGGWPYGVVFGVLGGLFGSVDPLDEITIGSNFEFSRLIRPRYWVDILDASWRAIVGVLPVSLLCLFVISKLPGKYQATVWRMVLFILICFVFFQIFLIALWLIRVINPVVYYKRPYQKMLTSLRADIIFSTMLFLGLTVFAFWLSRSMPLENSVAEKVVAILITCVPLFFITQTVLFRHSIARFSLYLTDCMPVRYVTFLDHMVNLRILEKDRAQWRFRHQNLQDYFGNLGDLQRSEIETSL